MRMLALDAATEACLVALLCQGELMGRSAETPKGHAQQILSLVEQVLAEGQVSLSMLDGIAASIGPGAFTGVRISVAVAQGLAWGPSRRSRRCRARCLKRTPSVRSPVWTLAWARCIGDVSPPTLRAA